MGNWRRKTPGLAEATPAGTPRMGAAPVRTVNRRTGENSLTATLTMHHSGRNPLCEARITNPQGREAAGMWIHPPSRDARMTVEDRTGEPAVGGGWHAPVKTPEIAILGIPRPGRPPGA